jgi:hypothetical protein
MGSLLATVLFAVPLITWLSGLILLTDSQWKLARPRHAPREIFPSPENPILLQSLRARVRIGPPGVDEVSR